MILKAIRIFDNLKKYLFQGVSRVAVLFLGLLNSRWIISNFSEKEYSQYTILGDSLNTLTLVIISFGIPTLIQKFYTNNTFSEKTKQAFGNFWQTISTFRYLSFIPGLLIVVGANVIFKFSDDYVFVIVLFLSQFVLLLDSAYRTICDSLNKGWQFSLTDIISKSNLIFTIYLVPLFIDVGSNRYFYVFTALFSYSLGFVIDLFWQKKFTPAGTFQLGIIRENFRSLSFISITSFITILYLFSGQLILKFFNLDSNSISSFSNAYNRSFLTLATVPSVIVPSISSLFKKVFDKSGFQPAKKYIAWVVFFGLGYAFLAVIAGYVVIKLIDPKNLYPQTYQLFLIMIPVMIFYPLLSFFSDVFVFFHKEKYQIFTASILAVFGLITQFLLTYIFGVVGLAIAFLLTMILDLIIKLVLFRRIKRHF